MRRIDWGMVGLWLVSAIVAVVMVIRAMHGEAIATPAQPHQDQDDVEIKRVLADYDLRGTRR